MKKLKLTALALGLSVIFTACNHDTNPSFNERDKVLTISSEMDFEIDKVYDTSNLKGKKAFIAVTNLSEDDQEVRKHTESVIKNNPNLDLIRTGGYLNIPYEPPRKNFSVKNFNDTGAAYNFSQSNTRSLAINDTKDFYAVDTNNNISTEIAKNAVLKAIGNHCNVWYVTKDGITVADAALQTLADTFDNIFECETYLFGSNIPTITYNGLITVDENTKVNIIVYDLKGDYLTTKETGGGTFGYFTSNDFILNDPQSAPFSNESECLHIDSYFLEMYPDSIRSTIAHEFQHLLHFVNKTLHQGLNINDNGQASFIYSDTWFNEMLSMVCEDIMQTQLGLKDADSPKSRLSLFNYAYELGFTTWRTGDDVYYSYANAYAFGAFLLRNFGIDFIKELASNEYIDKESITQALIKYSNDPEVKSFDQVLSKFYNVVMNPKGTSYTLNKSVTRTYEDVGGDKTVTFNCSAINLFDYLTLSAKYMNSNYNFITNWYEAKENTDYYGPYIFNDRYYYTLAPSGMFVSFAGVIKYDTYKFSSQYFNTSDTLKYKIILVD